MANKPDYSNTDGQAAAMEKKMKMMTKKPYTKKGSLPKTKVKK